MEEHRGNPGDLYSGPEILSRIVEVYGQRTGHGGRGVVEYPGLEQQTVPSQCHNGATGEPKECPEQLGRREVANGTGLEETFPLAFPQRSIGC